MLKVHLVKCLQDCTLGTLLWCKLSWGGGAIGSGGGVDQDFVTKIYI